MMLSSSSSPSLKPYPPHSPLRGGGFSLLKMVAPTSPSTHLPSPKFNLPLLDTTAVPSSISLSYAAATASCNFSSPPLPTANSFSFIKNPIHHQNSPPPPSSSSTPAAADVQKSNKKLVFRIRTTAYKAAKPNPSPNPYPKNITDDHHPPKSKVMSNGAGPAVEGDNIKKLLLLQQGTIDTAAPSGHDDDADDEGFVPNDRVGIPADHCLHHHHHHHHQAGAKPRLIQTKKGNHSKKRKLTLLLTDEEIEEDIFFMTGEKPARIPKPNNKRAMEDHNEQKDDPQHNMDKVFPGLRLGSITTKSYRVRP